MKKILIAILLGFVLMFTMCGTVFAVDSNTTVFRSNVIEVSKSIRVATTELADIVIVTFGNSKSKILALEIPEVKIPEIELPKIESPSVPKISMPDISLPEVNFSVPKPHISIPKVNLALKTPQIPQVKIPKVNIPKISMPDISLPEVNFSVPKPHISIPKVNLALKTPQIFPIKSYLVALIPKNQPKLAKADDETHGQVLAAHDDLSEEFAQDLRFEINLPVEFNDTVSFQGLTLLDLIDDELVLKVNTLEADEVIAPNLIYSLTAAADSGLTITGTQNLTIINSDKGSSQNIFKNFKLGSSTASAGSNSDTFEFAAGSNVSLSLDTSNKKLTINSTISIPSDAWIDGGTNVYLTTSTDNVGIGTSSPASKLEVVGTTTLTGDLTVTGTATLNGATFGGNITLGDTTSDTITFTGRLANGTSILPAVDLGSDLGSASLRYNNIYAANLTLDSGISSTGQVLVTYNPADTTFAESSIRVNVTSPSVNEQMLGIGQGGEERASIDAEGDLTIGYDGSAGSSVPETSNPFNVYGHSTSLLASITSAGATLFQNSTDSTTGFQIFDADGGTPIFNVDTTNERVGIGTLTPNDVLEILSTTDSQLRLAYNGTNYQALLVEVDGGLTWSAFGTDADLNISFAGATDGDFSINSDDLFVDTSTGMVGIGTSAPANSVDVLAASNTTFDAASAQGQSGQGATLRLQNSSTTTNSFSQILFTQQTSSTGVARIASIHRGANATDLAFATETSNTVSEKMRILGNGNVGIGTTTPALALHVGSTAVTDGTALLRLQDANSTCDFTADTGAPLCGSDVTLKKNIASLDTSDLLTRISNLRPVSYNWKTDGGLDPTKYGFIAQEVEQQFPELVREGLWIDGTQRKFLNMGGLMPYVVGAIKQQQTELATIKLSSTSARVSDGGDIEDRVLGLETRQEEQQTLLTQLKSQLDSIFSSTVTFLADVTFRGRILMNPDQTGRLTIPAGATQAKVTFKKQLPTEPMINLTPRRQILGLEVKEVTTNYFIVTFTEPLTQELIVDWLATLKDQNNPDHPDVEFTIPGTQSPPIPTVTPEPTIAPEPSPEGSPAPTQVPTPSPTAIPN